MSAISSADGVQNIVIFCSHRPRERERFGLLSPLQLVCNRVQVPRSLGETHALCTALTHTLMCTSPTHAYTNSSRCPVSPLLPHATASPKIRYTFLRERRAVMHSTQSQPSATASGNSVMGAGGVGDVDDEIGPSISFGDFDGRAVRSCAAGAGSNGWSGSHENGGVGNGSSESLSRTEGGSPRGEVAATSDAEEAGSLVRTLALSNFGDRPAFLEVRRCSVRTFVFPGLRGRRPLLPVMKLMTDIAHKAGAVWDYLRAQRCLFCAMYVAGGICAWGVYPTPAFGLILWHQNRQRFFSSFFGLR